VRVRERRQVEEVNKAASGRDRGPSRPNWLRENEGARHVLENMPVLLIAYGADARGIIVWNRECERITGYSADEIIGNPRVHDLLYRDRSHILQVWENVSKRGDDYRDVEWEWVAKDGTIRTISWSNISARFPIPGWGTWAVGIDITAANRPKRSVALERERLQILSNFIAKSSHEFGHR
jgi:PAS domain S-box-containing protein